LASAGGDEAKFWDPAQPQGYRVIEAAPVPVPIDGFGMAPRGALVGTLTVWQDSKLRLWDLRTGEARATIPNPYYRTFAVSPDCKAVALGSASWIPGIRMWDLRQGKARLAWQSAGLKDLAFAPDGR